MSTNMRRFYQRAATGAVIVAAVVVPHVGKLEAGTGRVAGVHQLARVVIHLQEGLHVEGHAELLVGAGGHDGRLVRGAPGIALHLHDGGVHVLVEPGRLPVHAVGGVGGLDLVLDLAVGVDEDRSKAASGLALANLGVEAHAVDGAVGAPVGVRHGGVGVAHEVAELDHAGAARAAAFVVEERELAGEVGAEDREGLEG
ncbi:MAG: hypothetical protein HOO96_10350, partial [Polyangiaceae bacterium]|nr:hypothetical protein [Polyangiaceae bacterium]